MRRKLGLLGLFCGLGTLAYAAAVLLWGDPITGFLAHRSQQRLARELAREFGLPSRRRVAFRVQEGHAFGRIVIPRIGLDVVFVQGTSTSDLEKGPGHYRITALPGFGDTVAIAGHRTTWGAWFRHVDQLKKGDQITLRLAYGTVRYSVTGERVVATNDWSILRDRGYHRLLLSTCDPPYSAAHRRIVFAREVDRSFRAEGRSASGLNRAAAPA